nr:MATE family efflux transporter [Salinisphaera sp. G21_0]
MSKLHDAFERRKGGLLFQSALAFSVRAFGAGSGFLLNLIIARTLPPQQAGYYFLAFTVIQVLAITGLLGLQTSLLRFIGSSKAEKNWNEASAAHKTGTLWAFLLATSLGVLLYVTSPWLAEHILEKPDATPALQAMSPSVVLFALLTLNAHALQAVGDVIKSVSTLNILVQLLLAAALLMDLATTAQTTAAFYSLACLLTMFISLFWWLRKPRIHWRGVGQFPATTLWQSCLPLWWVTLMGLSVQWGGQLISAAYLPPEELAILAVTQRTAMLTSFILMAINLVVAPKFAGLYKLGKIDELKQITFTSTRLLLVASIPLLFLLMVFPSWILSFFGKGYEEGGHVLRILAAGQIINVLTGSVGMLLAMCGHEKDLRNALLITGPMAIVLAIIFIPLLGLYGAALSTAIPFAIQNLFAARLLHRRLGFSPLSAFVKFK